MTWTPPWPGWVDTWAGTFRLPGSHEFDPREFTPRELPLWGVPPNTEWTRSAITKIATASEQPTEREKVVPQLTLSRILDEERINHVFHDRKGRPYPMNPVGVMVHHTASARGTSALEVVKNGTNSVPGPLYQILIERDGMVRLITNGYANHAGKGDSEVLEAVKMGGDRPSPQSNDASGNPWFFGVAIDNDGRGEPLGTDAYDALVGVCAAICYRIGWNARERVVGHKEWTSRKVDPNLDMECFRWKVFDCAAQLALGRQVLESAAYQAPIRPEPDAKTGVDIGSGRGEEFTKGLEEGFAKGLGYARQESALRGQGLEDAFANGIRHGRQECAKRLLALASDLDARQVKYNEVSDD